MAFWDAERGVAFSDSVDGQFVILRTDERRPHVDACAGAGFPPALANEGAFAASGTNVAVHGTQSRLDRYGAAATRASCDRATAAERGRSRRRRSPPGHRRESSRSPFATPTHGIVVGGDYQGERPTTTRRSRATAERRGRTHGPVRIPIGRRRLPGAQRRRFRGRTVGRRSYRSTMEKPGRRSMEQPACIRLPSRDAAIPGWGAGENGRIFRPVH